MKWKFVILTLGVIASIFLFAFASSKRPATPPVDVASNKLDASLLLNWQNVSQENWNLSLPPDVWEATNTRDLPAIKMAFKDVDKRCMVILLEEDDPGSLVEFVTRTIRVAEESDILILAAHQITLNGTDFILLKMNNKADIIWSWITVKNGVGYNLSCEQLYIMDASSKQKLCYSIADTFQIK